MIGIVRLIDDFSRLQPSASEFHLLVRSERWTQSSFEIDLPHRTELRIWCVYTTVGIDARDRCHRCTTFFACFHRTLSNLSAYYFRSSKLNAALEYW